jgi:D-arabinose 5-phosphate isomerase GutQ
MRDDVTARAIWQDVLDTPANLQSTLALAEGFDAVAERLLDDGVGRVVAAGNGASYYVAHALWLASLAGEHCPREVIAVPAGLVAQDTFRWRQGDLLLAISSSGELRDLVEAIESSSRPEHLVAVTASPDSTIARAADAVAVVVSPVQRAVTHTHAFCGAIAACLARLGARE